MPAAAHVLISPASRHWKTALTGSQQEREMMAQRDLRHAILRGGRWCPAAQEAARKLCEVFGVNPDTVVHRVLPVDFKTVAEWRAAAAVPLYAWQKVLREARI